MTVECIPRSKRSSCLERSGGWPEFAECRPAELGDRLATGLAVALAHDEVERTEDGDDVAHHVAGQDLREDGEVAERRAADLQPVRGAAAFAVDVEAEFAL